MCVQLASDPVAVSCPGLINCNEQAKFHIFSSSARERYYYVNKDGEVLKRTDS
jgi:hypothetical protein